MSQEFYICFKTCIRCVPISGPKPVLSLCYLEAATSYSRGIVPHMAPRLTSKCAHPSRTCQRPELGLKDGGSYAGKERANIIREGIKSLFKLRVRHGKLQVGWSSLMRQLWEQLWGQGVRSEGRRQKKTEQAQRVQEPAFMSCLSTQVASPTVLTTASRSTRRACLKGPQRGWSQISLTNRIMEQKGCPWHLLMTGHRERRSVQLFQKKIEIQYTLEKVEDQGQFQPVSNTGCPWAGGEICSNTRSEMKGFVTFLDGVAIYCY